MLNIGNKYLSIPVAHSVHVKESHTSIKGHTAFVTHWLNSHLVYNDTQLYKKLSLHNMKQSTIKNILYTAVSGLTAL
jgi:hypothetical protein